VHNKRRTDVVLVGGGDETLLEIGPALGDEFRTYSVDTASDIADLAATSWIGLYDATGPAASRAAFAQLESQFGLQPWIILCADDQAPQWQDVLARGSACAVVTRSQMGTPSLAAALTKAAERTARTAQAPQVAKTARSMQPLPWALGAAVIILAAASGWWLHHSRSVGPTAHSAAAAGPASRPGQANARAGTDVAAGGAHSQDVPRPAAASVDDLLSQARVAFANPATQLPKADAPLQGTSALELYGAVLTQQPRNDEALDGVRRLQSVARLRVQNDLASGDVETAARLLAILEHSDIDRAELRTLESAIAVARPKQLASQARSAMAAGNLAAARQYLDQLVALSGDRSPVPELRRELDSHKLDAELSQDADQVRAAVTAGTLLEPEGNNARTRLLAMRELSRTNPQTLAAQHDLLLALLRRAEVSISHQDLTGAQRTLTAAQDFGTTADLAEARAALDAALSAKRTADAASAAAAEAARTAVKPQSPAHSASQVLLSPKLTRALQIDFPESALEHNIQGYVVVEFTLNPNGSVAEPTVVESVPAATFDQAALTAVKRARFATQELANPRKPQRARIRINFTLADTTQPAPAETKAPEAPTSAPAAAAPTGFLSPKPIRPLQVDYPEVALTGHINGYAIVEFMLNPNGTAGAPTIVAASPRGVFDRAALAAVKGAVFATNGMVDPNRAQRARVKINFDAQ
jgi:TonB family protein